MAWFIFVHIDVIVIWLAHIVISWLVHYVWVRIVAYWI